MSSTLEALSHHANSPYLVTAGEVVELRFKDGARALSLRAAKLFHLLVNHAGMKAAEDIEHRILVSSLNFSHLETEELVDCIRELIKTTVELTFFTKDGKKKVSIGSLLSEVERPFDIGQEGKNASLSYRISPTLRKIIVLSHHWSSFSREIILSFESRYALRLFEIISLRVNLEYKSSEIFELSDLKRRFGVPDGKLIKWIHFMQTALDPAIKEINKLSGFNVFYERKKTGRSISHIVLYWSHKAVTERAHLANELAALPLHEEDAPSSAPAKRPEPQDKPRRAACQPFPPQGGLSYGQNVAFWRELAETHVKRLQGGHIPDLNTLAATFRAWCAENYIPLDLPTIDKTFTGFCRKYVPDDL